MTVSVPVTGLTSDTTYHVRIVATNAAGVTRGSDKTFKTLAPAKAPTVSTGGARSVKAGGATLTGALDPAGQKTTFHFEYGTSTRYGVSTPDATADGIRLAHRHLRDRRPRRLHDLPLPARRDESVRDRPRP